VGRSSAIRSRPAWDPCLGQRALPVGHSL